MFVTAGSLQRTFGLPRALAREIINEETQRTLRCRWQPWAWALGWLGGLASGVGLGWVPWRGAHVWGLVALDVAGFGWILIARWLGGEAMLAAAAAKARRLARWGSPG